MVDSPFVRFAKKKQQRQNCPLAYTLPCHARAMLVDSTSHSGMIVCVSESSQISREKIRSFTGNNVHAAAHIYCFPMVF